MGGIASSQGLWSYIARRRAYAKLDAQLRGAQDRLAEKQTFLAKAQKDDEFLELEARRHLGLVRADEIEFRFMPKTKARKGPADETMERRAPSE